MTRSISSKILLLAILLACSTQAQTSSVKTVFIILMENHNWSQIKGSSSAPYINNTLLPQASHAEQYFNPPSIHPSLPNYLWLEAGTNFGITNDSDPSVNHQSTTLHLATQLSSAGISWKSYQEDISGTVCPLTSVDKYAPKHDSFVYFDDVTNTNDPNSSNCVTHVRPYTELATDLANGTVAQYNFITPNLCDDMHDSCAPLNNSITQGDTWLSNEVPKILNSNAYKNGGALFITWDEAASGDGPIGMILLSPFAKGGGYSNSIHYTHGSTLRTFEEIFGVALIRDAASQTDLRDLFLASAPPAPPTGLTATPGDSQVALLWTASAGAASYNVKHSTTSGGPYTTIASGQTATNYTDTGLTNGATYYYVVTAVNSAGESGNSNQASAAPEPAPPSAPTNLTAVAGNVQVSLSWTAPAGAVSYNVKRSTTSGGPYSGLASGVTLASYTDNSVTNGTTYYYVVSAINGGGESLNSKQASATPGSGTTPVYQVNCGGTAVSPYQADAFFNGGTTSSVSSTIDTSGVTNPAPMAVYQSWRTGTKSHPFTYTLPGLAAGSAYTVRLHFSENVVTSSGVRKFNVSINGTQVLSSFDVFAAAGGADKAVVQQFSATANSSGQIVLKFSGVTPKQGPIVNGIEILH